MSEPSSGASSIASHALTDTSRFLVELAATMHELGFPADRIEDSLHRAARGMGIEIEALVLQGVAIVELRRAGLRASAMRRFPVDFRFRLSLVREIDDLVDALALGSKDFAAGFAALREIRERAPHLPAVLYLAGSAVYSASIAARLGGAWLEMLVAGVVALVGRAVGSRSNRRVTSTLVRSFLVGLIGALVTLGVAAGERNFDSPAALFGGIVLMVPAMLMTIAAHELGCNLLESGALRLIYAVLRFVLLAAGIAAAVHLWALGGAVPSSAAAHDLPWLASLAVLVVGAAGLAMSLQASYRDVPWVIGSVLLAVAAQKTSQTVLSGASAAPLVSAFVVGAVGYAQARIPGHTAATVIVPGILQLVPGFLGTRAVLGLLSGVDVREEQSLLEVVLIAVQLALGVALAAGLARARPAESFSSRA